MNWKQRAWKIATSFVVLALIFSILPEAMALGLVINGIGLEIFLLLLEIQILVVFGIMFYTFIRPVLSKIDRSLMKIDPNYFIPGRETIVKYPPILFHAVPGLISLCWWIMLHKTRMLFQNEG